MSHNAAMRESRKLRRAGQVSMDHPGAPSGSGGSSYQPRAPETHDDDDGNGASSSGRGGVGPKALQSFLRNFLSDDLGSFRSEINLKDHGDESGTEVRDVTIQEVADMHPDLRSLTLSGCSEITDVGLWALARSCTGLKELRMSRCEKVTHIGLRSLSLRCRALEVIDLSNCPDIDDMGLRVLASGCWGLHTLNFKNCPKITDTGLTEIARMCKHLRDVDVSGCSKVCEYGDKALVELASNCHELTSLNLTGEYKKRKKKISFLSCVENAMQWYSYIYFFSVFSFSSLSLSLSLSLFSFFQAVVMLVTVECVLLPEDVQD